MAKIYDNTKDILGCTIQVKGNWWTGCTAEDASSFFPCRIHKIDKEYKFKFKTKKEQQAKKKWYAQGFCVAVSQRVTSPYSLSLNRSNGAYQGAVWIEEGEELYPMSFFDLHATIKNNGLISDIQVRQLWRYCCYTCAFLQPHSKNYNIILHIQQEDSETETGPTSTTGELLMPEAIQRARDSRTGGHTKPSSIGTRSKAKRSAVWNFFRAVTDEEKEEGEQATHKCTISDGGEVCGKAFTASGGSASNLFKHLKQTVCKFNPDTKEWDMKPGAQEKYPNHLSALRHVLTKNPNAKFKVQVSEYETYEL